MLQKFPCGKYRSVKSMVGSVVKLKLVGIEITLVRENTLLPAFAPFVGNDGQTIEQEIAVGSHYDGLGRFPKRVVSEYGGVHKLCLRCLRGDIALHGAGYWHCCHQVPSVRACWKHRESLVSNCPICRCPVSQLKAFLSQPWKLCPCVWVPTGHGRQAAASEAEMRYAEFVQDLILKNVAPIKSLSQ
jgi:hypothetical protein